MLLMGAGRKRMVLVMLLLVGALATVQAQDDVNALLDRNEKLIMEKAALKDSLAQYKSLYAQSQKDVKALTDQLSAQAGIETQKQQLDTQKQQLGELQKGLANLDKRIYQTAYLYPTEVAYDSVFIVRTNRIASAFEGIFEKSDVVKLSDNYQLQRNTYKPLLEKYPAYITELEAFVNDQLLKALMANGGAVPKDKQAHLEGALKNTKYYTECYVKRNTEPYPSLPYLDKFVDKTLALIKKSGNVESEAQALLHSLRPNAPVKVDGVAADFQQLDGTICQLLGYPLEVAYDSVLITRTRTLAQQYEQTVPVQTERFAKQKKACEALYAKYKAYTNELINFMNERVKPMVKTGEGKVPHTQAAGLKGELMSTAYCRECYGKSSNIPFLDTFVRKVGALIESTDNVEKKLQKLTNSLHPND